MFSKPLEKLSPVPTDDICWETCPTKETSPLVAHQSVDEPRDLTLENVASSMPQIVDGRSSSSAAGTTCSNPCPENQYLLPGIDHDGEQMYFILTNRDLWYSPDECQKATTAVADVACWETCPMKEMSSLVTHQSVDELRDLALENESQQESSRPCSKSSTSEEDDMCQEKLLTAKTAVLSTDRNFNPERTHIRDEYNDLVIEQDEDDVVDIIYDGKQSRPPDVVNNGHTKSNVDSCTSLSAPLMHLEAWVADKVKAP
jgi:hypothetical protein